jgi:hypothetical protein
MSKLNEILRHAPVKFDTPVSVKMPTPIEIRIYSIEKTNDGEVMVQINDGSFHKLEETDRNYDLVADQILNRLHGNNTL